MQHSISNPLYVGKGMNEYLLLMGKRKSKGHLQRHQNNTYKKKIYKNQNLKKYLCKFSILAFFFFEKNWLLLI